MAHSVQGFTSLGLLNLRDESLDSLEQRLRETARSSITGTHILHTYIAWLGGRLKELNPSDDGALKAMITSWCSSLRVHGVNANLALFGFLQWKREQLSKEPTHTRIFTLAGLEIQKEFRVPDISCNAEAGNATAGSQGSRPALPAGPGSDNQPVSRKPESDNPLGQMHPSRIPNLGPEPRTLPVVAWEHWTQPGVDLTSDISEQAQPAFPSNTTTKPSFLTGANGVSPFNSTTSIAAPAGTKYTPGLTKKQRRNARKKEAREKTVSAQDQQPAQDQPAQAQPARNGPAPGQPLQKGGSSGILGSRCYREPKSPQKQQERITTTPERLIPEHPKPSPPRSHISSHHPNRFCGRCGKKGTRRFPWECEFVN